MKYMPYLMEPYLVQGKTHIYIYIFHVSCMNIAKWFITTVLLYLEYCSAEMLISCFKVFILFIYGFCIFKNTAQKKSRNVSQTKIVTICNIIDSCQFEKGSLPQKNVTYKTGVLYIFSKTLYSQTNMNLSNMFFRHQPNHICSNRCYLNRQQSKQKIQQYHQNIFLKNNMNSKNYC